jgi:NAD(P)-dependent dehydrogenase (short-subunit alcohol dehydrogenase family)
VLAAWLWIRGRTAAPLETVKSANLGRVEYIADDVSAPGVSAQLVRRALDTFGRLDAVVVSHGVLEPVCKIADADVEAWREAFERNFFSVVSLVWTH